MKKILLALAVLASVQFANAQVKNAAEAAALIAKAQAGVENPKKALKAASWIALGKAYVDAYNGPSGNAYVGASRAELKLLMSGMKPLASSLVTVMGQQYEKEQYENMNLYFEGDRVAFIEVTKPFLENPLEKAVEAYAKAAEVEPKGPKTREIGLALADINTKYINDAYGKFSLGDLAGSKADFAAAVKALATPPLNQIDTSSLYNVGFTAHALGQYEEAKAVFDECIGYGYLGNDGDVFAKAADCASKLGDPAGAKDYLEKGFQAYPQSQSILIGLINYYISNNENPEKLFTLLDEAKKNEPDNASLYYVEGNIYSQLGDTDKAVASYRKCAEVDPSYEYGYIGEAVMRYSNAVKIQEEASKELDDAKYAELVKQFEKELKSCIEPFEKSYEITKDEELKLNIAEYLKNAFYRFREESDFYKDGYDKYDKIVAAGRTD
ncbi:MAG: tetratricopeptide repeat protein [Bacteroidales bacterium]|nr:tetratricopeptide repeat protein [Bacteroidales bacterium]